MWNENEIINFVSKFSMWYGIIWMSPFEINFF